MRTEQDKKEYAKLYREKNRDKINEWHKKDYILNKDIKKEYANDNAEKIKIRKKNYYLTNSNKIKDKAKEYYQNNKNHIRNTKAKYCKNKRLIDPLFKLKSNIYTLIGNAIRESGNKKISKTQDILGCSILEFRKYLESLWESWMGWDNYGNPTDGNLELNKTWDIDHIIPISSATCEEDILKLNHYTNLQPLCSFTNRYIKRDNIT